MSSFMIAESKTDFLTLLSMDWPLLIAIAKLEKLGKYNVRMSCSSATSGWLVASPVARRSVC
jgi:hypothetical protein